MNGYARWGLTLAAVVAAAYGGYRLAGTPASPPVVAPVVAAPVAITSADTLESVALRVTGLEERVYFQPFTSDLTPDVAENTAAIGRLQRQVDALPAAPPDATARIDRMDSDFAAWKARADESAAKIDALSGRIEAVRQSVPDLTPGSVFYRGRFRYNVIER